MEQAFILLLNFNHQGEGSEQAMTEILAAENPPVARQPVVFLLHKSSHSFCRMWAPAVSRVPERRASSGFPTVTVVLIFGQPD